MAHRAYGARSDCSPQTLHVACRYYALLRLTEEQLLEHLRSKQASQFTTREHRILWQVSTSTRTSPAREKRGALTTIPCAVKAPSVHTLY